MPQEKADQIERNFVYYPPDAERAKRHEAVRDMVKGVALFIVDMTPAGREQSLALTKL